MDARCNLEREMCVTDVEWVDSASGIDLVRRGAREVNVEDVGLHAGVSCLPVSDSLSLSCIRCQSVLAMPLNVCSGDAEATQLAKTLQGNTLLRKLRVWGACLE